jgi:hypothetical protein
VTDLLWTRNASPAPWAPPASFSIGFPTSGDVVTQTQPTRPGGHWFDSMYLEIRAVIEGAGLAFDPTDTTQFLAAILILLGYSPESAPS